MLANHMFWQLMHFYTHLLLLLQLSVQWLSIVNFNNDAKPPPKGILREFDVSRIQLWPGGLPHIPRVSHLHVNRPLVVANRIIDVIDQIATGLKFCKYATLRELPLIVILMCFVQHFDA